MAAAVLAMGDKVWQYEAWQERTKHCVVPFCIGATTADAFLTSRDLDSVRALARRLHAIEDYGQRIMEFQNIEDNDQAGKASWVKWYKKVSPGWKLRNDIEIVLNEHGRHPRQMVSAEMKVSE